MSRSNDYMLREYRRLKKENTDAENVDMRAFRFMDEYCINLYSRVITSFEEDKEFLETRISPQEVSIMRGKWSNVTIPFKCKYMLFDGMIFENCTFKHGTLIDSCMFIGCTFINCVFEDTMRWVSFLKCKIISSKFNLEYIRDSRIDKKCVLDDVKFNIDQIDGFLFVLGVRYKSAGWHKSEINQQIFKGE